MAAQTDLVEQLTHSSSESARSALQALPTGEVVRVLARWGPGGGPRNVLIELPDGRRVVRPFRGLRRLPFEA